MDCACDAGAPKAAALQVRVEVLGYAIHGKPVKVRSTPATRVVKAKLDGVAPLVIGPITGVAGMPPKAKKISGVVLQVRTKGLGADAGSLHIYGLDGSSPATRSAPVTPGKKYTTLVVAEVGTDGKLVVDTRGVYRAPRPEFDAELPYTVGLLELEEGVFFFSRILPPPGGEVSIGAKVALTFREVGPSGRLPVFQITD